MAIFHGQSVNPHFQTLPHILVGATSKNLSNAHEIAGIITISRETYGFGWVLTMSGFPFKVRKVPWQSQRYCHFKKDPDFPDGVFHSHGGTLKKKHEWFIVENAIYKWMRTRGTH